MRLLISALFAACLSFPAFAAAPDSAPDRFEFDKSHTRILFFISHMGFSETVGEFTEYDGILNFDETKPEASKLEVTLKPAGIRTPSKPLDEHLQNKDFFNVAEFPEIRFVSTSVKVTGENTGDVMGNLTILGVTKPVTMHVTFNKGDYHPMSGAYVAGFKGEATLKRSDFGMTNGIPMVGDEVKLLVHTELVNQGRKKQAAPKTN